MIEEDNISPRPSLPKNTPGVPLLTSCSVAEVLLHAYAANFNVYKLVGTPPPVGVNVEDVEKTK